MKDLPLSGLIPAVVLPMTRSGEIDEPELRRYIHWLLAHEGLSGVAVNADTGEGMHLSREERRRVLDIWVEEAAGRVKVVAGIGGPSTANAVAGACDARDAGADALLVFPIPSYLGDPLPPELPYAYHRAIEDAAGMPMVLFQLQPALGGTLFHDDCWRKMLELKSVVAVKEASFDAQEFVRVRALLDTAPRPIALLTGNDNFIYESFVLGADGALIGFGTLAVEEQVRMVHAARHGDWETARRMNEVVGPLSRTVFAPPVRDYRARVKYALKLMGVISEDAMRAPLMPLDESSKSLVRDMLERTGQLAGSSNGHAPSNGKAVPSPEPAHRFSPVHP